MIARVAVSDGHADSVTIENVPSFVRARSTTTVEVPGYGDVPYSLAFGGNFYAMVDLDDVGLPFDRARQQDILAAGLAIMDAINDHGAAAAPADRRRRPLPPRRVHRPGLGRPALPARDGDLPGLVRPLAVRHRNVGADGRALGAAASWRLDTDFVNESFIGSRFIGRLVAETDGRRHARPSCRPSPAGPG